MFAGSMMGTIAGVVIGSAIADVLLGGYDQSPEAQDAGDTSGDAGSDSGDGGSDSGDAGSGDARRRRRVRGRHVRHRQRR